MKLLPIYLVYSAGLSLALGAKGIRARGIQGDSSRPPSVKRILIIGATGGTGRELVRQALERGFEVTALVRDPAKLQIIDARLRVAVGDVLDRASLDGVTPGQDAVISALGHRHYFSRTRVLSQGTRNVLSAMEAHNVSRFVCETALGIGSTAGRMGLYYSLIVIPLVLPLYFWDKCRQERTILASTREWIIVRPGALTNGPKRGAYRHGPSLGSFLRTVKISRADVADFMLNQLSSNQYLRSAVAVCN